jgi:polar amino acid transport system substrate-binding protein
LPGKTFRSITGLGAGLLAGVLLLTGCGGNAGATGADQAGPAGVNPTADVTSGVHTDPAIAALLPASVRSAGVLNFAAVSQGGPPFQYFLSDNTTHVGLEIDIRDAVAKVLGVTVHETLTSFESVLPGLADGKYDVGQGNFGVTEERKQTVDFVTYYDDGYGFAVRAGSPIKHVNAVGDLCGLRVATGVGTDFATTLQADAKQCDAAGKPEYTISTFPDQASGLLALTQNHADIYLLTAIGLEYDASQSKGQVVYLGKLPGQTEHIGFALKKGSPLDVPIQQAVQELIDNGTYAKILAKWGLADAAITRSQLNPPGLT